MTKPNELTREKILAMESAELNKLVAIHVMKWQIYHYDKDVEERCYYMLVDEGFDPVANEKTWTWHTGERKTEEDAWKDNKDWCGELSAAWELIKTLHWDYSFEIRAEGNYLNPDFEVEVKIGGMMTEYVKAATAPEAICKAALLAVMDL